MLEMLVYCGLLVCLLDMFQSDLNEKTGYVNDRSIHRETRLTQQTRLEVFFLEVGSQESIGFKKYHGNRNVIGAVGRFVGARKLG
jgi:hypothetical protein